MNTILADYFEEFEPANVKAPTPRTKRKTVVQTVST